jgi:hypothetical protein
MTHFPYVLLQLAENDMGKILTLLLLICSILTQIKDFELKLLAESS